MGGFLVACTHPCSLLTCTHPCACCPSSTRTSIDVAAHLRGGTGVGSFVVACTHPCSLLTSPRLFPTCPRSLPTCPRSLPTCPRSFPPAPVCCTPVLVMARVRARACRCSHPSVCARHCLRLSVLAVRVGGGEKVGEEEVEVVVVVFVLS